MSRHTRKKTDAAPVKRAFRLRRRRSKVVAFAMAGGTLAAAVVGVALTGPGGAGAAPAAGVDAESANQAALVAAEDRRLIEIRSVAAVAPLRGGTEYAKPYRLTTGSGYTLVLTSRSAPYTVSDLLTLAPQTFVRQTDGSYLLLENLYLNAGAKLTLANPGGLTVRLASASTGFVSIVSFGGALSFVGTEQQPVKITSWDPRTKQPDTTVKDGRAYVRSVGGQFRAEYLQASNLGFWSGRTGGVSLTGTDRPDTGKTEGPDAHQDKAARHASSDTRKEGNSGPAQPEQTPAAGDVYAQPSGNLSTPDTRFGTADASFVSAKITHTTFDGNAYGLFISSADGIEVSDSTIERSLIDGVILHRFASNGILERVTSNDNAGDGFVLARATQEIRISAATAKNNGNNGISLTGRALAEGPSPSGETIGEYGNNSIANSTLENNKRYGIEVDGGTTIGLQNNQVRGGDMGIVVRRGAQAVSVVGNQVSGQVRQGISVRDAVVGAVVTGNTVESSPLGIYLRDSSATIRGNTVDKVTSHGVTAVGDVKGSQISYNTVSGTGATAVDAARSHGKLTVQRNQTDAWHDTRSFWVRLRHAAKPMTLLWLGVVLLVLVSAVRARKLGARGSIRHPYEKQRLLDTTDKGELLRSIAAAEQIREREPELVGARSGPGAGFPAPNGSRWDPAGVDQETSQLPARTGWRPEQAAAGRPDTDRRPATGAFPAVTASSGTAFPAVTSAAGPTLPAPISSAGSAFPAATASSAGTTFPAGTASPAGGAGAVPPAGARPPVPAARTGIDVRPTWSRPEPTPEWKPRADTPTRTPEATPDRTPDWTPERVAEPASSRTAGRAADRAADRSADRTTSRAADRAADRSSDRSADRTVGRPADRLSDLLAERVAERRADRTEWPAREALPAPGAPNLVIGRTGRPGPGHPSDGSGIPAYQEDATTQLRRPDLPTYQEDATTVLPRPRRSAENDAWKSEDRR